MQSGLREGLAGLEKLEVREPFFLKHLIEEGATETRNETRGLSPFNLNAAEVTGDRPANTSTVCAAVDAVCAAIHGCGARSLKVCVFAAALASTLKHFPAVDTTRRDHRSGLREQRITVARFLIRVNPLLIGAERHAEGSGHLPLRTAQLLPDHLQFTDDSIFVIRFELPFSCHHMCPIIPKRRKLRFRRALG